MNQNGGNLITFCVHNELRINHTYFPHKQDKYTFGDNKGNELAINSITSNGSFHLNKYCPYHDNHDWSKNLYSERFIHVTNNLLHNITARTSDGNTNKSADEVTAPLDEVTWQIVMVDYGGKGNNERETGNT